MIIENDMIEKYIYGAEYIEKTDEGIIPHRFSREEELVYADKHPSNFGKTISSAGVKLEFVTDASAIKLVVNVSHPSSRSFFSIDFCENNKYIGCIKNYDKPDDLQGNPKISCHPNDSGFEYYARKAAAEIKKYI